MPRKMQCRMCRRETLQYTMNESAGEKYETARDRSFAESHYIAKSTSRQIIMLHCVTCSDVAHNVKACSDKTLAYI